MRGQHGLGVLAHRRALVAFADPSLEPFFLHQANQALAPDGCLPFAQIVVHAWTAVVAMAREERGAHQNLETVVFLTTG